MTNEALENYVVRNFIVGGLATIAVALLLYGQIIAGDALYGRQVLTLPFVFFFVSHVRIGGRRVPRGLLACGIVGIVGLQVVSHLRLSSQSLYVKAIWFPGDELGAETRILARAIEHRAGNRVHVDPSPLEIGGVEQARAYIERQGSDQRVLIGNDRWLTVVNPDPETLDIGAMAGPELVGDMGRPAPLELIARIPVFGVSRNPEAETTRFLGNYFELERRFLYGIPQLPDSLDTEFRALSSHKAAWTSNAHRAVGMLLSGVYHTLRFLRGNGDGTHELGELLCGKTAFSAGLLQLRPKDNAELKSALVNNLAITEYLMGRYRGDRGSLARAKKLFRTSKRSARADDVFIAKRVLGPIIERNISALKTSGKRQRSGKGADKNRQRRDKKERRNAPHNFRTAE